MNTEKAGIIIDISLIILILLSFFILFKSCGVSNKSTALKRKLYSLDSQIVITNKKLDLIIDELKLIENKNELILKFLETESNNKKDSILKALKNLNNLNKQIKNEVKQIKNEK